MSEREGMDVSSVGYTAEEKAAMRLCQEGEYPDIVVPDEFRDTVDAVAVCFGTCMAPAIRDRDYTGVVSVGDAGSIERGDIVGVLHGDGEEGAVMVEGVGEVAVQKRVALIDRERGVLLLACDNPLFRDAVLCRLDRVQIRDRAVWVATRGEDGAGEPRMLGRVPPPLPKHLLLDDLLPACFRGRSAEELGKVQPTVPRVAAMLERRARQVVVGGVDQFAIDTQHAWLHPEANLALDTEGDFGWDSTLRASLTRIGSNTRRMKGQRYVRTAIAEVKSTTDETTVDTDTILAATWGAGKAITVSCGGQGYVQPQAGAGRWVTLRVKLGATTLLQWMVCFAPAAAGAQSKTDWGCRGVIVPHTRGSTATVSWHFITDSADIAGTTPSSRPTLCAGTMTLNTTADANLVTTIQPSVSAADVGTTLFGTVVDAS